ncbi:Hsp20/alpha crystallin family protein [Paraburkholderia panacisoli]|jgi:HSP20 family protein|uniref:Hsp20/alpha crystallin family protein n=2 Tax=Paraburkholderia panacisoli TaxID=2603818 RepID=A0A5B0G723_9BURK|nr:Hsp20/alpha crystallin family protein [Paraburkholderia panacisoli]
MKGSFTRFSSDVFPDFERLLQEQMDAVVRNFGVASGIRAGARGTFPPINIGSTVDAIEVVAFLAGVDPQALQVSIDKGLLILSGERPAAVADAAERKIVYADERFSGKFRRVVSLPDDADPARVEAKYADGCLRVTVMKRESSKPRLIQVQ